MKAREPLHWTPSGEGYRAEWSLEHLWPRDQAFVIETILDEEGEEPSVAYLLRHGDGYVYRWTVNFIGDSVQEYRYGLRAVMLWAERYRWALEVEREVQTSARRAFFAKFTGLSRLRQEGFELWLQNEFGSADRRERQWEAFIEWEVRKRLSSAS